MNAVEALMARYFAAWGRGDNVAAMECYAEDVVMWLPGRSPISGEFRGRDAVIGAIEALTAGLDDPPDVEVEAVVYGDSLVAAVVAERVRGGGHELAFRRVVTYRVEDERIHRIEIFHEDEYAVDEFFSRLT